MALHYGFFDAVMDEDTYKYDREYNADDFTGYFGEVVGSGVCIHNNENSMKVSWVSGAASVAPGYLFIRGYWLKNTARYSLKVTEIGTHAVIARLVPNAYKIEITTTPKASPEQYPDALVLGYVTRSSSGSIKVEDTRYRTDICGVIDSAGSLSNKVQFALNYIDNEIEDKLAEAEAAINAQTVALDKKIAEVNEMVKKLAPPPIGTVKFSASDDVGEGWLPCDGRFVNEKDYPDLVSILGKTYPSGDKFTVLSNAQIGPNITNGVIYNGKMWVYSFTKQTLYGVDLTGKSQIKSIKVTSKEESFSRLLSPTNAKPLCLSIVPNSESSGAFIFLSQIILNDDFSGTGLTLDLKWLGCCVILQSEFVGTETTIDMTIPFRSVDTTINSSNILYKFDSNHAVPYISTLNVDGTDMFQACVGSYNDITPFQEETGAWVIRWNKVSVSGISYMHLMEGFENEYQRTGFSKKNKGEIVVSRIAINTNFALADTTSFPSGIFDFEGIVESYLTGGSSFVPVNVAGATQVVCSYGLKDYPRAPLTSKTLGSGVASINLPVSARNFVDAGAYLWGKDIFMFFVGTGIIFSRTMETGDFGYLDTTGVLGTITQFGYLDYSEDEGTLYIVGQDSSNRVKVAKMVLNTLFDYANDGAWLPLIASDGIPAYIKALEV